MYECHWRNANNNTADRCDRRNLTLAQSIEITWNTDTFAYSLSTRVSMVNFQNMSSLLEEYNPIRTLLSAAQPRLREPPTHSKYGERAFSVVGPKLWNGLPQEVKNSLHKDSDFQKCIANTFV